MSKDQYYIEALGRGLGVLEAFSRESPDLSLTEIAEATGLSKSTAFRFAYTLEELGFLKRDPETLQYRPGLKVLRLGFTALNSLEMGQIAQPYLKALSAECGWTTNMTVRDEAEIVYVARNKTQQILSVDLHLGSRLPVYCTSMGKAQLIDLSRQELHGLLGAGPYERRGPNTITTLAALAAELDQVRLKGYAVADEELAPGLRAVAAPVRGHSERVVAAVNVSVPSVRVSREELENGLAPRVVATARQISGALGATAGR
ncbi:MAG: IclR family transcriptional regulator C-terminal domain-containing protein [Anaerolineae bacterium]|jgi:IclR family pca regulon transcriptional regulator